jgi:hypothetical protein
MYKELLWWVVALLYENTNMTMPLCTKMFLGAARVLAYLISRNSSLLAGIPLVK